MPRGGLTCRLCDKPMQLTRFSRPQGEATCRECTRTLPKPPRIGAPHPERPCESCGTAFSPRYVNGKYCSRDCHAARPRGSGKVCEVCGETYVASYYRQRTCGRVCGAVLNHEERPPQEAKPATSKVVWHRCKGCAKPYTSRGGRSCDCMNPKCRVFITDCRVCGSVFVSQFTIATCSSDCARVKLKRDRRNGKDKRRALERKAHRQDVDRLAIWERDGYRCKLCGKALRMTAAVPHPLAPTIDHILPLARGGTHEPKNVQAAHFRCNSVKSDGGGNEQLLLIG